jgi:hypothetical protein
MTKFFLDKVKEKGLCEIAVEVLCAGRLTTPLLSELEMESR